MLTEAQVQRAWQKMETKRKAALATIADKAFAGFLKELDRTEADYTLNDLKIIKSIVLNNDVRNDIVLRMVERLNQTQESEVMVRYGEVQECVCESYKVNPKR